MDLATLLRNESIFPPSTNESSSTTKLKMSDAGIKSIRAKKFERHKISEAQKFVAPNK